MPNNAYKDKKYIFFFMEHLDKSYIIYNFVEEFGLITSEDEKIICNARNWAPGLSHSIWAGYTKRRANKKRGKRRSLPSHGYRHYCR